MTCLPCNGEDVVAWPLWLFGECVTNARQMAGVIFGILSIVSWIFALFPQLWENFKNKRVESLSFWFMFAWVLGDSSNLAGCILTNQLPTQIILAYYFCSIDVLMIAQMIYYTLKNRKRAKRGTEEDISLMDQDKVLGITKHHNDVKSILSSDALVDAPLDAFNNNDNKLMDCNGDDGSNGGGGGGHSCSPLRKSFGKSPLFLISLLCFLLSAGILPQEDVIWGTGAKAMMVVSCSKTGGFYQPRSTSSQSVIRALEGGGQGQGDGTSGFPEPPADGCHDPIDLVTLVIGTCLAWISSTCYFTSRLPQIYKNYKRKSVEGLSIFIFISAVCGNITYAMSIFLKSTEASHLMNALPFIIGSCGTVIFDLIIFGQYYMYGKKTRHDYLLSLD